MSNGGEASAVMLTIRAADIAGRNALGNMSFHANSLQDFNNHHIAPLRRWLPDSSPLVEALETEPVRDAVRRYADARKGAIGGKKAYGGLNMATWAPLWLAIIVAFVAVLIPAGAIADTIAHAFGAGDMLRDRLVQALQSDAPWVVYAGVIATAMLTLIFRPAERYRSWQQNRAQAEALRREVFKRLFDGAGQEGSSLELPLKLEYFRRWQVEVQHEYFLQNKKWHDRRIWKARALNLLLVAAFLLLAMALASSAVAGYDEQGAPSEAIYGVLLEASGLLRRAEEMRLDYGLVLLGVLAATAVLYTFAHASLSAAKRNAPRYKTMLENFDDLLKDGAGDRLTFAREAAARGDAPAVRDYVERVHSIMTLECNDWVRLADLDQGRDDPNYFRRGLAERI
jgi:hypothetical protein